MRISDWSSDVCSSDLALIEWDDKVLELGEAGKPISRWDGETMKPHPVTGKPVPDEEARVEVWRYVKPRAAKWPKADFIVGNPPFIGQVGMRAAIGDGYLEALFATTNVRSEDVREGKECGSTC